MRIAPSALMCTVLLSVGHIALPWLVAAQETPSSTLLAETEALARELQDIKSSAEELIARYERAEGEEQLVLRTRISRRGEILREKLTVLVGNLRRLREAGQDVDAPLAVAADLLEAVARFIRSDIERSQERIAQLRQGMSDLPVDELLPAELSVTQQSTTTDQLAKNLAQVAAWKQALGLDAEPDFAYLEQHLDNRAETLASRIRITLGEEAELTARLSGAPEDVQSRIRAQLSVLRESQHGAATSLDATVKLMDERGLDTAEYRQLLIRVMGAVTTDVFDVGIAFGLLRQGWRGIREWLVSNAPQILLKVLIFLLILAVFRVLARITTRFVKGAMARTDPKTPQLLKDMAVSGASKAVMILGLLIALSQLGIQIGPMLAGLGVAGFIAGFALQESLSNFAAGLLILFYHPFDVGDVVETAGVAGTVKEMSLVSTTILTFDNQKLVVPNRKIWGDVIRNKTSEDIRRVDMIFGISYADDFEQAERVLRDIVERHELVLEEPAPAIRLHTLGESSVDFIVRPWTKTSDYWSVYWDVTQSVKKRFDEEGITIPFPQRDVHFHPETPAQFDPGTNPRHHGTSTGATRSRPSIDADKAESGGSREA